jgi:hypothetical protein
VGWTYPLELRPVVNAVKVTDAEVLKLCTKFWRSGLDDRLHWRTRCGAGEGANKIELFWPGCFGGLARWRGEVKETEGELRTKDLFAMAQLRAFCEVGWQWTAELILSCCQGKALTDGYSSFIFRVPVALWSTLTWLKF